MNPDLSEIDERFKWPPGSAEALIARAVKEQFARLAESEGAHICAVCGALVIDETNWIEGVARPWARFWLCEKHHPTRNGNDGYITTAPDGRRVLKIRSSRYDTYPV